MSKYIRIVVPGQPVSKLRQRVTKSGHAYTPEKTVKYENLVKDMWRVYGSETLGTKPVEMRIDLRMKIPESESKKRKELMLSGGICHVKKPDADNCAKSIMDALNGLAYKDDSQIIKLTVEKRYDSDPKAIIHIMEA